MKNQTVMLIAVTGFFLLLFFCIPSREGPQAQQRGDPSAIVMAECTVCHTTQRICDDLDDEDQEEWTEIISEMVSRGARVAEHEIPLIAEYLSNLEPGSKPVCR